jgi:hypothetical protein
VTGAVLVALACEPAWERKRLGIVPPVSAALGAVGFALAIALVWAEPASETWAKVLMTTFTVAAAGVVASLLALARVAPRHAWLVQATLALLAVAAALYAFMPWLGDDPGPWFVRTLAVVMIALAAFTVTVPVVHWLDRASLAAAEATGAVRFCPYCGRGMAGDLGEEHTCARCGREFSVSAGGGAQTST